MVKNIVIISQYFAPAWSYGGPPRVLYVFARELIKLGIHVNVITTDVLDEKRNTILQEMMDGIKITRFRTISNYLAYKAKLMIVLDVYSNSKEIIQHADCVLFSDVRTMINWQLFSLVYNLKIPYGIFAFGEIPHGEGYKAQLKKIIDKLWVKSFIKKASFRFSQTEHEQKMFFDYFGIPLSNTQLLPLPVELKQQKVGQKLLEYNKKKWGIDDNDKVILYVGRLHVLKGIDLLISAIAPLLQDDPHLKLLIVGRDDGEESNLRNFPGTQMKKQIIFTGPLYEKDVDGVYNIASCFVITPRFYEETSSAALEALSFGVPVIITKQAEIPFLEEYKAGNVIDNNPKMIQKAIIELLRRIKKDEVQIKANSRKLISDKFSAPIVTRKLLSIINDTQHE